jgi:hypothetical protein
MTMHEGNQASVRRSKRRAPRQHVHVVLHHEVLGEVEVDEGIADVIRETWRGGILTVECCQGRYEQSARCKLAFIAFHAPEAERWMKVVCADPPWFDKDPPRPGSQEHRDQERWLRRHRKRIGVKPRGKGAWRIDLLPYDGWEMSVEFTVLIWFPSADLPDVLRILREHNARLGRASGGRRHRPQ